MAKELVRTLLLAIIITGIFTILVFLVVRRYLSIKLNKRIKNYVINKKEEDSASLVDLVVNIYLHIASKMSAFFKKHHLFTKYCQRFDKYLLYIQKGDFDSMDFVSGKFITTLLIDLLYILVLSVKTLQFNGWHFLIINIISFFLLDFVLIILYNSRKKIIEEQLLQAIIIMNSAFKSGKNIYQAVQIIKNELPNPIKEEFMIIAKDLDYGLDVNAIFARFYERVKVDEAKYITSSLSLLSKTGGSVVDVFDMIEKKFYNRLKVRNELKSMTATSKLLKNFLCFIPLVFAIFIMILDPNYFKPLYSSVVGIIVLSIIIIFYLLYIIIIRQIMKVDEV